MNNTRTFTARPQQGFVLIEALVAFVVLAFGMLTLAAFQATLSRNSDVAKQRGEAVRLAQEKLEDMRSFSTLTPYTAYTDVAEQNVAGVTSNTTFRITQGITTSTDPDYKVAKVDIEWNDRYGAEHKISLDSVIAGVDPKLSGRLGLSQWFAGTRRPKNRALTVPYPSKDLGNGESVFKPIETGTRALVFNNASGIITRICTVAASTATANLQGGELNSGTCEDVHGYLVQGFVRFDYGTFNPTSVNPTGLSMTYPPVPLTVSMSLTAPSGSVSTYPRSPAYECFPELRMGVKFGTGVNIRRLDVATDAVTPYTDNTVSPAETITSWTVEEKYLAYACVVFPADHDNDPATMRIWNGRVMVALDYFANYALRLCRYSFDYDNSDLTSKLADSNFEHPDPYAAVNVSMTDQNFLVIKGGTTANGPNAPATCPADTNEINFLSTPRVYSNYNTIFMY